MSDITENKLPLLTDVLHADRSTLDYLLTLLNDLIEEINIPEIGVDHDFNPNCLFDSNDLPETTRDNSEQIKDKTKYFLRILKNVDFPGNALQYSQISQTIFSKKSEFEQIENISEVISKTATEHCSSILDESEELSRRFYKLIDHMRLASFQISEIAEHFSSESEGMTTEIENSKRKLKEIENELKLKGESVENLNKEITKIYTQFVSILGIFTAIVISVFGGLGIINGVFESINVTAVWKIVLVGSMASIATLSMLFILTKWITSIINVAFERKDSNNLINIIKDNGAFSTGIFIFCYLIIASVIFSSPSAVERLKSITNIGHSVIAFVLLTLPIIAGFILFIKILNSKNK